MKTQTDKVQESQKETVQRLQQEHSTGGKATIQDNRSKSIHQLKLKNRMTVGDHNTIQLKALDEKVDKKKLNVIGENHLESGGRRKEEKSYTRKVFGMSWNKRYWTEGEFSSSEKGKKEYGDNPHKRIDFIAIGALIKLKEYSYGDVFDKLDSIESENKKMKTKDPLVVKLSEVVENVNYENVKRTHETGPLIQGITEYLQKRYPLPDDELLSFDSVNEMEEFKKEVSNSRGVYMSQMANKAAQKKIKGIWKVGDNHINQIEEAEEERNFNLLSMNTFNEIYNEYQSKNK